MSGIAQLIVHASLLAFMCQVVVTTFEGAEAWIADLEAHLSAESYCRESGTIAAWNANVVDAASYLESVDESSPPFAYRQAALRLLRTGASCSGLGHVTTEVYRQLNDHLPIAWPNWRYRFVPKQ